MARKLFEIILQESDRYIVTAAIESCIPCRILLYDEHGGSDFNGMSVQRYARADWKRQQKLKRFIQRRKLLL
mgnify:CR=1 FL=1